MDLCSPSPLSDTFTRSSILISVRPRQGLFSKADRCLTWMMSEQWASADELGRRSARWMQKDKRGFTKSVVHSIRVTDCSRSPAFSISCRPLSPTHMDLADLADYAMGMAPKQALLHERLRERSDENGLLEGRKDIPYRI